jgi:hypothetical protein
MGTGGPFPGGKSAAEAWRWPLTPPSSAEVVNEQELYLLSPQAPSWCVAGLLYFLMLFTQVIAVYTDIHTNPKIKLCGQK